MSRVAWENDAQLHTRFPNYAKLSGDNYQAAWVVLGWQVAPDQDTEWSGILERTGLVALCMVGDDHIVTAELDDLAPLQKNDYCQECGAITCKHGR